MRNSAPLAVNSVALLVLLRSVQFLLLFTCRRSWWFALGSVRVYFGEEMGDGAVPKQAAAA